MIALNPHKARSLVDLAKRELEVAFMLQPSQTTASTIVRNIYESFRMLGEARLTLAGIKSADHNAQLKELERLRVKTARPLSLIHRLKRLRNEAMYEGKNPRMEQAKDAQDFAEKVFDDCAKAVLNEINEK